MASIKELTHQTRAAILSDIMDRGRSVTPEQFVARERIAELETACQDVYDWLARAVAVTGAQHDAYVAMQMRLSVVLRKDEEV